MRRSQLLALVMLSTVACEPQTQLQVEIKVTPSTPDPTVDPDTTLQLAAMVPDKPSDATYEWSLVNPRSANCVAQLDGINSQVLTVSAPKEPCTGSNTFKVAVSSGRHSAEDVLTVKLLPPERRSMGEAAPGPGPAAATEKVSEPKPITNPKSPGPEPVREAEPQPTVTPRSAPEPIGLELFNAFTFSNGAFRAIKRSSGNTLGIRLVAHARGYGGVCVEHPGEGVDLRSGYDLKFSAAVAKGHDLPLHLKLEGASSDDSDQCYLSRDATAQFDFSAQTKEVRVGLNCPGHILRDAHRVCFSAHTDDWPQAQGTVDLKVENLEWVPRQPTK